MTSGDQEPRSKSARLAAACGLLAAVVGSFGAAGARFGLLEPYTGFAIFALSFVLGTLLALGLGVVGLWRTRGKAGRPWAILGIALGIALAAALVGPALPHRGAPPIHDVATDVDDPPEFREIARLPENEGRDLSYPHGGDWVRGEQLAAYPDLKTLELGVAPGEAYEAAVAAVEELGWSLVWSNRDLGLVEASETSRIFRFTDDVVIRIRAAPAGSAVDVRSTSRVGRSDLGANARRVRKLLERLEAAG